MSRETQLWIFLDIETSGPVIGTHSMIELGAVVGSIKHGVLDRFDLRIQPIGTAVTSNPEAFLRAQEEGKTPADAMKAFAAWCRPYEKYLAIFVLRPAAFDWPWIVWYARTYLGTNPFGFRVVCAMSWYLARGKKFDLKLPPEMVKAAELQLVAFLKEA
jgi:hypothetical protein